jgi:hypothetical protein
MFLFRLAARLFSVWRELRGSVSSDPSTTHKNKTIEPDDGAAAGNWPKNRSVTMIASAGVLMILAGLVTIAVVAIADHLDASALDPAFCSPTSLHDH